MKQVKEKCVYKCQITIREVTETVGNLNYSCEANFTDVSGVQQ